MERVVSSMQQTGNVWVCMYLKCGVSEQVIVSDARCDKVPAARF